MSYNILGINFSHNSSVCVLSDGKVDFFVEEDRLSRRKYDSFPDTALRYVANNYFINEVVVGGLEHMNHVGIIQGENTYSLSFSGYITVDGEFDSKGYQANIIFDLIKKYFYKQKPKIHDYFKHHHYLHGVGAFFNSGFDEAVSLVIDGSGALSFIDKKVSFETESIFDFNYNKSNVLHKSYRMSDLISNKSISQWNLSLVYELVGVGMGFKSLEAGKTMGLSSYGQKNHQIPKLLVNNKGSKEFFEPYTGKKEFCDRWDQENLLKNNIIKEKYLHFFKNPNLQKDLAYRIQKDSEIATEKIISKIIRKTGTKNICCAGGYFLNCVNNYKLVKKFPQINFYFDPLSSDAGISIGAAKLLYYQNLGNKNKNPQTTLYYGPKYSKQKILKKINKYLD